MIREGAVIILLCLFAGCQDSPEKPETLIAEETYISLLVELQLVRTYSETGKLGEAGTDSLRKRVFREYEVSDTAFWDSHKYYQQFPSEQKKRVEKAIEQLRMDRMERPDQPGENRESAPGD